MDATPRIGPFSILAPPLERAGCVVYRCRDSGLPRELALKAVRPEAADPATARRRLWREAEVRAVLNHPHALPLYRAVRSRGGLLLVGPWLPGGSLEGRLGAPLRPADLLAVADGVGGALDALHAAGWWHGDVSAGNVLFAADGRAVLIDFGAARRLGEPLAGSEVSVTPYTAAPEVWDRAPVDGRSDLYSLGVLLYLVLTGAYPFEAETIDGFAPLHGAAPVPLPSERAAAVGPALESVLLRALAKQPAARFASGAALAAALRTALRVDGLRAAGEQDSRVAATARPLRAAAEQTAAMPWSAAVVRAAGAHVDEFAAGLDQRERAALDALLRRARSAEVDAAAEGRALTMQTFAPAAALLALEATGAADALADGARTARETARACGVPEHALGRVLQTLAALGLLGREGDRFCLPPGLAALYRSARRVGATARPIGDAAMFWGHLPHWAATGTPCTEMDRPDGAVYAQQVGRLGASFGEAARELAALLRAGGRVPAGASILDIGAGSGVWSLALAATDAAAAVTALDREPVLEITRVYAAAAGLAERLRTIAGDWRDAPLPDGAFDLVVLANLCHLEPGPAVLALLRRAYAALRPGGTVVVVDMIPERDAAADLGTLLEGLHLGLRTPDGGVHDREQYRAWLKEAGFIPGQALPLPTTRGARAVQLGHRRCPADCVHRRGGAGW